MIDKAELRKRALDRRCRFLETLDSNAIERVSMRLVERFQRSFQIPTSLQIATYYPREDECDVRLLNFFLGGEGHALAYPRIEGDNLSFRIAHSKRELVPGTFGLLEPPESAIAVQPDVFIVPLLAFDSRCHRLGYGKGHYDRVLHQARSKKNVLAIGVAYDMQRIDEIPNEPLDQQLEYVVTEAQVYKAVL